MGQWLLENMPRGIDLELPIDANWNLLIAGTAMIHNLILATRNVKDLASLDVNVVNSWEVQ